MKVSSKYNVIGLMSGTSLDGLDLVHCEFFREGKKWRFSLIKSETKKYNPLWRKKLSEAHRLPGMDMQLLDNEFGFFIGHSCNNFIKRNKIHAVDFIASHGHTVFHQPENKLTFQLGNGVAINSITNLPVVNDFRSLDVLKGGQGAPLVPIGDHHLFSEFDVCLNLGGIANLSRLEKGKRTAFDICFANMGLNYLAEQMGKEFDKNGKEASRGIVNQIILEKLGGCYTRFRKTRPSLGREGFEKHIQSILDNEKVSVQDRLRTFCDSICAEIVQGIPETRKKVKVLATGGGALNQFLIELLQARVGNKAEIIVPDKTIVNYKEAIIFGFLGVLRVRDEINVLKQVTGATSDSSAGTLIGF